MERYTLCGLLFADYLPQANRLLSSWEQHADWSRIQDVRLALNEPSPALQQLAQTFCESCPVPWFRLEVTTPGVGKYPVMRRLFYGLPQPLAPRTMWFDDDSCLRGDFPNWWGWLDHVLNGGASQVGRIYTQPPRAGQWQWVQQQPWYTGQSLGMDRVGRPAFHFATGGWWVTRTDILTRWDWPHPDIDHNGGDTLLGELLRQQQRPPFPYRYRHGVWINADDTGRPSSAPRRGRTSSQVGQPHHVSPQHDFAATLVRSPEVSDANHSAVVPSRAAA